MTQTNFQQQGQVLSAGDARAMFLKLFTGEVLAAHRRIAVMSNRHRTHSVTEGKSYTFPAIGRALAQYLPAGRSLDDQRVDIQHNERVIYMDELLVAECMIMDIYEALNHFPVRSEYANQLGESLALATDGAVIATLFNSLLAGENIPTRGLVEGTGKTANIAVGTASAIVDKAFGEDLLEKLAEAKVHLDENHVPPSQRYFLTSPANYASMVATQLPFTSNWNLGANQTAGTMGGFHGFEIVPVPHLLIGGAAGEHQIDSSILSANPVGVAYHYGAVGTVQNIGRGFEMGRRIEYQADHVVARMLVGHGVLRPENVVVLTESAV